MKKVICVPYLLLISVCLCFDLCNRWMMFQGCLFLKLGLKRYRLKMWLMQASKYYLFSHEAHWSFSILQLSPFLIYFLPGWFRSSLYLSDIATSLFFPNFSSIVVHWLQCWSLQLKNVILLVLEKQRLSHGEVQAFGTPRRLLVWS